jgi:hypothetical protein
MKAIKNLIYFISVLSVITSCEKKIDLKLVEVEPKMVVDAQVTNSSSIGSFVKLSKTKRVQNDNSFIPVTGALVAIQENNGSFMSLTETQPGIYKNTSLVGRSNQTYRLRIIYNGQTITSTSIMPIPVNLDSLIVEDFPQFDKTVKVITPIYSDPIGLGNYYNFQIYRNGNLIRDPFPVEDLFIDGKKVSFPLFYTREADELKKNDIVDVEMYCVDKASYKFWYSLSQSATGSPQSVPNNPISNIVGNAIGLFSANTFQKKRIIIN